MDGHEYERNSAASAPRRTLSIDVAKYQAMIGDPELSEAQKRDFVEALWTFLITFVDLGFELHTSDIACGQLAETETASCSDGADLLKWESILKSRFADASGPKTGAREESGHDP